MPLRVEPVRDRKLHRLIKAAPERATRKGEILFRQGEPAEGVWVVQRGHVRLQLDFGSDAVRTVAIAGPHELFGDEATVPGAQRPYTAVAGERSALVGLEGATVRGVLRSSHHTLTAYLEVKERDLEVLRRSATGSPGATAAARLAGVVVDLTERLGEPDGKGIRLPLWFTHRELADLAGAHRSTVTTCLNDWIWRGLIETRKRSLVVPETALDALRRTAAGHEPTKS